MEKTKIVGADGKDLEAGKKVVAWKSLKEMSDVELRNAPTCKLNLVQADSRDGSYTTYTGRVHIATGLDVSFRLKETQFFRIIQGRKINLISNQANVTVAFRLAKGFSVGSDGVVHDYIMWECLPVANMKNSYLHGLLTFDQMEYVKDFNLVSTLKLADRGETKKDDYLLQFDEHQVKED